MSNLSGCFLRLILKMMLILSFLYGKIKIDEIAKGEERMPKLLMPVGNTDFKEIRETGLYYIDKTMLIDQLVGQSRAKVTLFTRPRRFGKSLNMSMLQYFFDCREKSVSLFEGLAISEEKKLCDEWMNKYPTILVSFKTVDSVSFENAVGQLKIVLSDLFRKHNYIFNDPEIDEYDMETINRIKSRKADTFDIMDSLSLLTRLLYKHHNTPVILLIDEYDVPMSKGDANDYYRDITDIMRSMYNKALKDNTYIKIAVLTGCLRIAEESIFTGLNNLSIKTIVDTDYAECFGFTNEEMNKLLTDAGLIDRQPIFKKWYDGYIFGNCEVYCPWDVLNYVDALQKNPNSPPVNYWANTSGNDAVKRFLNSDYDVTEDFETLLHGGYVSKIINPNITYGDLTDSETNLWSVLYMTGYLTLLPGSLPKITSNDPNEVKGLYEMPFSLKLPNKEIRLLFEQTIAVWFEETVKADERTELFDTLWSGDADKLTEIITDYLYRTISYFDYKEDYYHAFLAGLLSGRKGIIVKSNDENGRGRTDIVVKNKAKRIAVVIETKRAETEEEMKLLSEEALKQIDEKKYYVPFKNERLIKYGIAFWGKDCFITKG